MNLPPEIFHAKFLTQRTSDQGKDTMTTPAFTAPLDRILEGARLWFVTATPATIAGRAALRVELTDEITEHGKPGVDYVDQPTFVELPVQLRTGVIEVDILSRLNGKTDFDSRAFAGIVFHVREDASAFQSVYLRPLNGRGLNPPPPRDRRAIQYFAYPDWPFDRLRDEHPEGPYEAGADIRPDEWITLRVEIGEHRIVATVDGQPAIAVDQPLTAPETGTIGLFVDIGTEAFFSNLAVTQL